MKLRPAESIFLLALASFVIRLVFIWIWPTKYPTIAAQSLLFNWEAPDTSFIEFLPNTVLLSVTNTGYLVMSKNLIVSLERVGIGKYLTIVSFEANISQSLLDMKEYTGRVHQLANEESTGEAIFNSSDVKLIAKRKILAIKYYLSRGHDVIYLDSDIVVLRDFRELLTKKDRDTYDAILLDGSSGTNQSTPIWFKPSTGLMYLRASMTTLNFTNLRKHSKLWNRTRDEQSYLIEEFLPYWKIKLLPKGQFANEWWVKHIIKSRKRLLLRRIVKTNHALYTVHFDGEKGVVAKARQHWRYGTFLYEGPGSKELLDLRHYHKERA